MKTVVAFLALVLPGISFADGIVCPLDAPTKVKLAAREIRRYVYLRTGTLLPVTNSGSGIVVKIDSTLRNEQFKLKTTGNRLTISGGSDLAVLYGAYACAERLGVRFYLHGDLVPDQQVSFALPDLDETGVPAFETRGILPFHDFPEGPDLWSADDYKAVLAQMVKLRMNFLGLHTYTECGWGSEPTTWLGLPQDVKENGDPLYSYAAHYFNTARDASGHQPRRVGDMLFGGALLLESDPWGPPVMTDLMPQGKTLEERNQVFVRAGKMLRDVFTYAHRFGVRTCVGTEIPLTDPARLLPLELRAHLKEKGLSATNRATLKELYKGTFIRAARAYPLDYYWLWTPESWRNPRSEAETQASIDDLQIAAEAAREVRAPFTLATAGWVLGPARDRAMFDKLLPKEMPFAALNLELGTVPVDEGFSRLKDRAGWAIPWMEDDLSMSSPELWVGRIQRDACDSHRYGCRGLIGIHWRTEEVGPMVGALAQAQWRVPQQEATRVEGGESASLSAPTSEFYLDWARHQFGAGAAREIAKIFARIDGHLPTPAPRCPGGIAVNRAPWSKVQAEYAFVDELAPLRPQIQGTGNLARFDRWVRSFEYLRAIARVACTRGELDRAITDLNKRTDPAGRRAFAGNIVLPVRIRLNQDWGRMMTLCLETADTWGSIGHVFTHEMFNRGTLDLLEGHDPAITNALGTELPAVARATKAYEGRPRLIVPGRRSVTEPGEALTLRVIVLDNEPPRSAVLRCRPLGRGAWQLLPLKPVARAVHAVTLPPVVDETIEYYIEAEAASGTVLRWPATAPGICQTVVVMPRDSASVVPSGDKRTSQP
jgi:hypothetical protein